MYVEGGKTILDFLPKLRKALALAGDTHTPEELAETIMRGEAQLWVEGDAMVVTQLDHKPQDTILVFWIAAGSLEDIRPLLERIYEWGRGMGCNRASALARRGWARVMAADGWKENKSLVVLEKEL